MIEKPLSRPLFAQTLAAVPQGVVLVDNSNCRLSFRALGRIDDPEILRTHLEIRLDAAGDHAFVIDTSSNGTLLNGVRIERAVGLPIRPGDQIRIGDVVLIFRSQRFTTVKPTTLRRKRARIGQAAMVMVVGDIINYSTISQVTDEAVMARSLHTLWQQLRDVLRTHQGTLSYYARRCALRGMGAEQVPGCCSAGYQLCARGESACRRSWP
ncbi:Mycobacterium numidiamassiliense ORFan [Mycobacterium numidiamassiliense]|uniref:Mycobacterium numidiamassiliense ORFan n=1 Tax=Mycobacterium numidiamassiliense TaxID=1841861 RepID=A0A2U3PA24_9MYCO|nr:FHA domain-containing protein [Mycobacterium numidiamassiliense]SPM40535.1 Mycobacterium numidiamassiliense ORFan [Mycobacterium numidiamassiliense]